MQSVTGQRRINKSNEPPPEVLAKHNLQKYLGLLVSEGSPSISVNVAGAHNSGPLYTKSDTKIDLTKHSTKTT